jgi:2-oxoisovalerate dehydrogenase E1 component beta subunit
MATVNPDGDLPGVANSLFLRSTRDAALKAPGIRWDEPAEIGNAGSSMGSVEHETRKMNMYQAIRDAMRHVKHSFVERGQCCSSAVT